MNTYNALLSLPNHPHLQTLVNLTHPDHPHLLHPSLSTLPPSEQASLNTKRLQLLCSPYTSPTSDLNPTIAQTLARFTPQGHSSVFHHCHQTAHFASSLLHIRQDLLIQPPPWLPPWFFSLPTLSHCQQQTLLTYLLHHDLGKPFVFHQDENNHPHFPHHPSKSSHIAARLGLSTDIQSLILHDSTLHSTPLPHLLDTLHTYPQHLLPLQLYAALASLWANSTDFGGPSSTSFKIKLKHLCRAYNRLTPLLPKFEAASSLL